MAKSSSDNLPVILLLSDSGSIRVFLKKTFGEEFYLLEVDSEQEVLEKLTTMKIKAVIFDDKTKINLHLLCQKIRNTPTLKEIPLIIISNNLKRSYMQELITAGASEFLREPLEDDVVLKTIKLATKSKAMEKKLAPLAQALSKQTPTETKLCKSRVSVHDRALKEISKALEEKSSISLLMIAIDHIEKVEQRWGALALKELLEKVEQHMRLMLRPQDILINTSNERFVILLPITSQTAANILAENIEESFKGVKFTTHKGSVKPTLSISVVTLSDKEMKTTDAYQYLESMLTTGEAYLEKAKKIGHRIVSN